MAGLLDQMPALVGVAFGAIASSGGAVVVDRLRWRRDKTSRWDSRRLEAMTSYAAALKLEARYCLRIAAATWPEVTTNPLSRTEGVSLLAQAEDRRSGLFEALLLLGDADTVSTARAWQQAVWRLHAIVTEPPPQFRSGDFLDLFNESGVARELFYDAARASLDVSGGRRAPEAWKGLS